MVIGDLDIVGITVVKPETDPPLVVYGDRILSRSIPFQPMQTVAWGNLQIFQSRSKVQVFQTPHRPSNHIRRKSSRLSRHKKVFSVLVPESFYHSKNITCHVTVVKTCWHKSLKGGLSLVRHAISVTHLRTQSSQREPKSGFKLFLSYPILSLRPSLPRQRRGALCERQPLIKTTERAQQGPFSHY